MFRESFGMRLRVAYLTFHRRAQAELSRHGVTADQFVVLSLLADEDGVTQQDLVAQCGSDSSTIAAMLKLLERDGLIQRTQHPDDRRAMCVKLKAKGRRRQQQLSDVVAPLQQILSDAISPSETESVCDALDRITFAMQPKELCYEKK